MSEGRSAALSPSERSRIAEIIAAHGAALRRFVNSRLGARDDRDDVIQEVYARLAGYRQLDTIHNPQSFLFRVAENIIRDGARRTAFRHTDQHAPLDDVVVADATPIQDRTFEGKQALAAFRAALLELEPRRRQAFLLSRVDGLRYREIADRMGLAVKTIEQYIAQALAHFRERLGEAAPGASSSNRER